MKSTYINDNKSSLYPFAIDQELPFSLSCFAGCGICMTGVYSNNVALSGVEIGLDWLAADVNVGGVLCGRLECSNGRCYVSKGIAGTVVVSGWILPGTISGTDCGVYDGPFRLDPRCITWLDPDEVTGAGALVVNGVEHDMPSVLALSFKGYFSLDGQNLSVRIPDDAVLTRAQQAASYPIVKRINNMETSGTFAVDPSVLPTGYTLVLDVDPDIASVDVQNALRKSDMLPDGSPDG